MNRLAIIPAAGNAARFGGHFKELLPVSNGENALQATYRRITHCETVLIITTPEKIALHAQACPRATFTLQQWPDQGLWGAVRTGLFREADEYYLTMPDTVWRGNWPKEPYNHVGLGVFQTYEPERFGVLHGNQIHDKAQWTHTDTFHLAWGALCWTKEVRNYWLENKFPDLPAALNAAMKHFGYSCFQIGDYYDFANLDYYAKYLAWQTSNPTPKDTA